MVDHEEQRELTKESVQDFFQKIKDGSIEPKGGNGFAEQIYKWIVEMVKFFVVRKSTIFKLNFKFANMQILSA